MGCCIGNTLDKLKALQFRLETKGAQKEAMALEVLSTRIRLTARAATRIQSRMTSAQGESEHLAGPAGLDKYYEECMKSGYKDKTRCAKLAWSIYCTHVHPGHPSCTSKGKDLGK
jgi:hypothetical protein